jgi:hypothetical protein
MFNKINETFNFEGQAFVTQSHFLAEAQESFYKTGKAISRFDYSEDSTLLNEGRDFHANGPVLNGFEIGPVMILAIYDEDYLSIQWSYDDKAALIEALLDMPTRFSLILDVHRHVNEIFEAQKFQGQRVTITDRQDKHIKVVEGYTKAITFVSQNKLGSVRDGQMVRMYDQFVVDGQPQDDVFAIVQTETMGKSVGPFKHRISIRSAHDKCSSGDLVEIGARLVDFVDYVDYVATHE